MRYPLAILVLAVFTSACSPLYVRNFRYETYVREASFEKADQFLDQSGVYKKSKNRLIYLFEKGKIAHMQGNYALSNQYFNEADYLIEDKQIDVAAEALSLITNDEQRPYKAEDFEAVSIHFYKALNYLNLYKPDEALVEARRINLRLQAIDDKFPDHKNRYDSDAMAHVLMGQIYESQGEFNNAFVAFRNAYKLFEENNNAYMGVPLPEQLKQDILRSAWLSGFRSELEYYERQFGRRYEPEEAPGGHLVLFWESGLGPVKSEWSLNFTIVPLGGDNFQFVNNDLGVAVPFSYDVDDDKKDDKVDIRDLQLIRVAFPKYVSRPDGFSGARITTNGRSYSLDLLEDYDFIARKALQDRFLREASRGLLRLAIKKVTELKLRKEDETAGAIAGLINAITEKADTRNWQTLPSRIYYQRIPLQKGENQIVLQVQNGRGATERVELSVMGRGRTVFRTYHSLPQLRGWSADQYYNTLVNDRPPAWWDGNR